MLSRLFQYYEALTLDARRPIAISAALFVVAMTGVAGILDLRQRRVARRAIRGRAECSDRITQIGGARRDPAVVRARGQRGGLDGAGEELETRPGRCRIGHRATTVMHE